MINRINSFHPFQLFIRFGITKPVSAVEEAKKKTRLARFGSTPVTDSAEEDKKKARTLRYNIFTFFYPIIIMLVKSIQYTFNVLTIEN